MPSKVPEQNRDLYEFKDSVIYPENSRIVRTVLQKTLFQIILKK